MSGGTKQKLFEATLRLSKSRGLVGLTVDDIAAEAGVAKGTVYYNFGSKDGLVDGLLRYGVDMLAVRLRSAVTDADPCEYTIRLKGAARCRPIFNAFGT